MHDRSTSAARTRIVGVKGPRRAEAVVLEQVRAFRDAIRADPGRLSRPLHIVVPSHSLRDHVGVRIVTELGAVAGVEIQTLHALALQVLARCDRPPPGGSAVMPALVRQAAREEPCLRRALDDLVDGYASIEGAVSDLFDAGFDASQLEAVEDRLGEADVSPAVGERARSVCAVAARVQAVLEDQGAGHRSLLLRAAQEAIASNPDRALSAGEVVVHGFADATGVATDLLVALLRAYPTTVVLDSPPEPGDSSGVAAEWSFIDRFRERMTGHADFELDPTSSFAGTLAAIEAPGTESEVRAIAQRLVALLEAGHPAESIAVVARDLSPYVAPLRAHLTRLGVAYSGLSSVRCGGALSRRVECLMALLRERERVLCERWLGALEVGPPEETQRPADLLLALRHRGIARLRELASATWDRDVYPLPVREFREPVDTEDGEAGLEEAQRPSRARRIEARTLRAASRRAVDLIAGWTRWPVEAAFDDHLERLRALVFDDLGWAENASEAHLDGGVISGALETLSADVPAALVLSYDDFVLLVGRALARLGEVRLGGRGAGVAVLGVMEARARSFDHLFVLGMNRDVFPRVVREDPLLPDAARSRIAELLPDIPIKGRGVEEERFLFAQLVGSSPNVTLSWQSVSDEGRARTRSTLIDRLDWKLGDRDLDVEAATPPRALGVEHSGPLPAWESALLAGLHGGREHFDSLLPIALAERARTVASLGAARSDVAASAFARARIAVLREIDTPPRPAVGIGPYFGFVGHCGDHPIAEWVTRFEQFARCPWRYFVERELHVEAIPDPVESLPDAGPALLGSVVHRVLDAIARATMETDRPGELAELVVHEPVAVAWPAEDALEELIREEARAVLEEDGIGLAGLAEVLARRARPYLECAREHDWSEGPPLVLGAEIVGSVLVDDIPVRFRADRVDRRSDPERLVLTDYKTGRAVGGAWVKASTRQHKLLDQVARGTLLQAGAYASASSGSTGRYLYLDPQTEFERRAYELGGDAETDSLEIFRDAIRVVAQAQRHGVFVPRLAEWKKAEEPHACSYCPVAEACVRGDSGARRRLGDWLDRAVEESARDRLGTVESSLVDIWLIGTESRTDAKAS